MTRLRQYVATLSLTGRRIRNQWAATLAVLVAMASLVAVWVGLPMYADAASRQLLSIEVDENATESVPFGYLFGYNRLSGGPKSWSGLAPADEFLRGDDAPFGSAILTNSRLIQTLPYQLRIDVESDATDNRLEGFPLTSATNFGDGVRIVDGRLAEDVSGGESLEVNLEASIAAEIGVVAGQALTIVNPRATLDDPQRTLEVNVVGLWATRNTLELPQLPQERFAFSPVLRRSLVLPETTMIGSYDSRTTDQFANVQWLVLLDADGVKTGDVADLIQRTEQINRTVDELVPGTRLLASPERPLQRFEQRVANLENGLAAYSLPTLILILAVVGLLVNSTMRNRRPELAMLRGRGVSRSRIGATALVEAILLASVAAIAGVIGARFVAQLVARTQTFLKLGDGINVDPRLTPRAWVAALTAVVLLVLIQVIPVLSASRKALDDSSRDSGTLRKPWWQRSYVDIMFITGVVFFGWWILRSEALTGDLVDDPVVIALPAATALAVGLLVLRLFPTVMAGLATVFERTGSTAVLLAFRRASRVRGAVTAPLLLIIITASLAIYTGSLAKTLDLQLLDRAFHQVGGANVLTDDGRPLAGTWRIEDGSTRPAAVASASRAASRTQLGQVWGIDRVSRLSNLPASIELAGGDRVGATFAGVDPEPFAQLAFWRNDYATESLTRLMANLQSTPDSVLLPRSLLRTENLAVGETTTLNLRVEGAAAAYRVVIVGSFDQFPTWTPSTDLPLIVGNITDAEARLGSIGGSSVLIQPNELARDGAQLRSDLSNLGIQIDSSRSPESIIEQAQLRPERQGIFGLLTLSFVLSAALTILGFVFYAVFGFTQQVTELGVLRALGLRSRGLLTLVGIDLFIVAATGIVVAVATGIGMSRWYLPRLIDTPAGSAPLLLPETDWVAATGVTVGLAIALGIVGTLLLLGLRRVRLFEAIKLGAGR